MKFECTQTSFGEFHNADRSLDPKEAKIYIIFIPVMRNPPCIQSNYLLYMRRFVLKISSVKSQKLEPFVSDYDH